MEAQDVAIVGIIGLVAYLLITKQAKAKTPVPSAGTILAPAPTPAKEQVTTKITYGTPGKFDTVAPEGFYYNSTTGFYENPVTGEEMAID